MELESLQAQLHAILADPYQNYEQDKTEHKLTYPPHISYKLRSLLGRLLDLPDSPPLMDYFEELVTGTWNLGPFTIPPEFKIPELRLAYEIFHHDFYLTFPRMLARLYEQNRLDFAIFSRCVEHVPDVLWEVGRLFTPSGIPITFHQEISPACSQQLLRYSDDLAWTTAQNLSEENAHLIIRISQLHGSRYLLEAARQHVCHQLGTLKTSFGVSFRLNSGIIRLASTRIDFAALSPDERQAILGELKAFPTATLKALLPVTFYAWSLVCEALDWQSAEPLIASIFRLEQYGNWGYQGNSPDPNKGVIDIAAAKQGIAQAGEPLAREILALIQAAESAPEVAFLYEAVMGWNRGVVEEKVLKHNQLSLKAYGLLPLTDGEAEVKRRYDFITGTIKDAKHKSFGAKRRKNEKAAVKVALANLAQLAGYADADALKQAMTP